MKNYASKQAKKGKLAFRTPSPIKYKLILRNQFIKNPSRSEEKR